MNKELMAKIGFAIILVGLIFNVVSLHRVANLLIFFGLCFAFFCFIDIANKNRK